MTYVLFIPWRRASELDKALVVGRKGREIEGINFAGEEHHSKNLQWIAMAQDNRMKNKKEFHEVWYTGRLSIVLFSMLDGQIYIRGHGLPGEPWISSGDKEDTHDKAKLHANDVVSRLTASGLQTGFKGKIKCYNCHSAETSLKSASFAQVFADAMWLAGYKQCTYWGYLGMLTSFYETRSNDPRLHKYAGYKEEFETGGWIIDDRRASERRMQIIPNAG